MPEGHTARTAAQEPIDSDVDLHRGRRPRHRREDTFLLASIALGGALGAGARYLIGAAWPTRTNGFPVSTWVINVLGCALIGVLMVLLAEVWSMRRLPRAFLGTGFLGGFTTFSTYTVEIERLVGGQHAGTALVSLVATPVGALLAVWVAATATRRLVSGRTS